MQLFFVIVFFVLFYYLFLLFISTIHLLLDHLLPNHHLNYLSSQFLLWFSIVLYFEDHVSKQQSV